MTKTLNFIKYTEEAVEAIGADHQILGLTHKGKYMLGTTKVRCYDRRVTIPTSMSKWVEYIAVLDDATNDLIGLQNNKTDNA